MAAFSPPQEFQNTSTKLALKRRSCLLSPRLVRSYASISAKGIDGIQAPRGHAKPREVHRPCAALSHISIDHRQVESLGAGTRDADFPNRRGVGGILVQVGRGGGAAAGRRESRVGGRRQQAVGPDLPAVGAGGIAGEAGDVALGVLKESAEGGEVSPVGCSQGKRAEM